MKFKKFEWLLLLKVLLMFIIITATVFCLLTQKFAWLFLLLPVICYQVYDFFMFHRNAREEVEQFVQSVHYRDFSRYFNVKKAPLALQPLRKGFNDINTEFRVISREKEMQYQYLKKILELVDTGILSYETETGNILWMNESLKSILQIPYLKTITSLKKRDVNLYEKVINLRPGDHIVAKIKIDNAVIKILLTATAFQTDELNYKLIAFQNVNEALDETESGAWKKLLSVMTHEIMNSVAPISSLAETLMRGLKKSGDGKESVSVEDLELGIDTIKRRSEGLLRFAETYRNLNKVMQPELRTVSAASLFSSIHQLMAPSMEQKNIEFAVLLKDPSLQLEIDVTLVEQMLINLVVNAIDAVKEKENPLVTLSATTASNGKPSIKITDNGHGIPEEQIENIFIPFFTTKKNGTGIGLSLCKQIMLLHKGTITVRSLPGEGTTFILGF